MFLQYIFLIWGTSNPHRGQNGGCIFTSFASSILKLWVWSVWPRGSCASQGDTASVGAGPRGGRWHGNGQFHLIKHSCRCFNFSGRKHISGMGQSGINCRPPGAFEWAAEGCRQGGYTPGSLPIPFQGSVTRSPTRFSTRR